MAAIAQAIPQEERRRDEAVQPAVHRGPYPIEQFLKLLKAKNVSLVPTNGHAHHTVTGIVQALRRADVIREGDVDTLESHIMRVISPQS